MSAAAPWRLAPMCAADLPQVMEIELRAYAHPWTQGMFTDSLKAGYSAWVLRDEAERIAAYLLLSLGGGEAQVLNICVDPVHRRQGLARMLLAHALKLTRAAFAEALFLEVRVNNVAAIGLYESFGFKRVGLRKNYYRDGERSEDAFVMVLDPWQPEASHGIANT